MPVKRLRATEDRVLPWRDVAADEVFEVDTDGPYGDWAKGAEDQPYFEDVTPAKRPEKKD